MNDKMPVEIRPFFSAYDKNQSRFEQIKKFVMFAKEQKPFVQKMESHGKNDGFIEILKSLSNSVVLYNAVIISIYGSFECYVDDIVGIYIDYLKTQSPEYNMLPENVKAKNLIKSAEYISNPHRFLNYGLTVELVIQALENTINNNLSSAMHNELLKAHGGNMKTDQLNDLLKDCGIENGIQRISKHKGFETKCHELEASFAEIDLNGLTLNPLNQIVEERNKIAHGWVVDDRISFSMLMNKHIPFIESFCEAIKDLFVSVVIQKYMDNNLIFSFGPILKLWGNGTIVGINNGDFKLKVNEYLFYSTPDNWNYMFKIENLKNNNENRNTIRARNKDIAILADRKLKTNYRIWGYKRED